MLSGAQYKHTPHIDSDALSFAATQLLNGGNESSIGARMYPYNFVRSHFLENLWSSTS